MVIAEISTLLNCRLILCGKHTRTCQRLLFFLKKSKNEALSSHPIAILFSRPISDIKAAHTSGKASVAGVAALSTSLTTNAPELGDSEGANKRTDNVWGSIEDEIVKMCGMGLKCADGMVNETVGDKAVGGSILGCK